MNPRALALVCVASAAQAAQAAVSRISTSQPHPGITYELWQDKAIPALIHLVRIDLSSAEIQLYATRPSEAGQTTSAFSMAHEAQVAINGDSFSVAGYVPRGLALGEIGVPWPNTSDDTTSAVFHFMRGTGGSAERTYAAIEPPEQLTTVQSLPQGTQGVISGRPLLVRSGIVATQFDCNDPITLACQRAPRSALALSADGNTLWLVVVDGWQAGSLGLTDAELAAFLDGRGVDTAIALDGGSSATLVMDGSLASSPSDGVERTVANHLAIKYGALPKGELYGLICRHTVTGCDTDPSKQLAGATVKLDDGRVVTTGTGGAYSFLDVSMRLACVTVKKTGYLTKTQCKQLTEPGQRNYNSVAMFEGTDPPDAGVVDAGTSPDADTIDGGGRDAGFSDQPPGSGGCCDAGRDRPSAALVVLVAWFLMRRRVTTA